MHTYVTNSCRGHVHTTKQHECMSSNFLINSGKNQYTESIDEWLNNITNELESELACKKARETFIAHTMHKH